MRTVWQRIVDYWDDMGIESQYGLAAIGALVGLVVILDLISWHRTYGVDF